MARLQASWANLQRALKALLPITSLAAWPQICRAEKVEQPLNPSAYFPRDALGPQCCPGPPVLGGWESSGHAPLQDSFQTIPLVCCPQIGLLGLYVLGRNYFLFPFCKSPWQLPWLAFGAVAILRY